jgi:hypothetical protein
MSVGVAMGGTLLLIIAAVFIQHGRRARRVGLMGLTLVLLANLITLLARP